MAISEKSNQGLMKAIRRMHTLVESDDLERVRASQENISALLKHRELNYEPFQVGEIPSEWVSVKRSHMRKFVIFYCHGGGYNTGSFHYARSITNKLSSTTSMDVLSFDYRLAPEHPYPSATEDAMAVWDYLMHLGYGARDVIVAGDSAGGNLALSLVLKLKEQKRNLPRGLILFGNFTGFPPTYIQVGSNELLLSDSLLLKKNLEKYHVPVRLEEYKGMWHVFQMSPFKTAYDAMDQVAEFIFDICR